MHDGIDHFNDVNVYLHFRIKKNQIKYIHDCATLKRFNIVQFMLQIWSDEYCYNIISFKAWIWIFVQISSQNCVKDAHHPTKSLPFVIIIVVETWNFVVEIPKGVSDFGNVIKTSAFIIILPLNKYHFELPSLH